MGATEKRIFFAVLALLILVAALYAYQTLASGAEAEVYAISVILCREDANFEKGLNSAAIEHNADVHIVTLSGADETAEAAALEREVNNGADAVVLCFANDRAAGDWLAEMNIAVPIVLVGDVVNTGKRMSAVSLDVDAQAQALVEEIKKQPLRSLILVEAEESRTTRATRKGILRDALENAGFTYDIVRAANIVRLTPGLVYVALDPAASLTLARLWTQGALVYGMGYDPSLRDALESGHIEALVLASAFDAGYLALSDAAARIDGARAQEIRLAPFIARADNMYEAPMSTILFPIG